jgi:luciferase family oxidoreductase group 1
VVQSRQTIFLLMPETNYRLSVLDLSPVGTGSSAPEALQNTLDLARFADANGFTRYWLAEHHNTPLIASSVPAIMIGQVASVTQRIRVGSGGVMLPNHTPLHVAESFRMLEALYPGRIDLGLGRAPGTDSMTALALRRSREALLIDDFPTQLDDLLSFLTVGFPEGHRFAKVKAMPDGVEPPTIWLLGSSDFSAQLAAREGLGFAFAHHIQPEPAIDALRFYLNHFKPSQFLREPAAMIGVGVVCADTDEEAETLASSVDLALLRFRQGRTERLASVAEASEYAYSPIDRAIIAQNRERLTVGSPQRVYERLTRLADAAGVREIVVTSMIHNHAARRHSYELLANVFGLSVPTPVSAFHRS